MARVRKALPVAVAAGVLALPSGASAGSWRSLVSVDPNSSRPVVVGDFVEAGTIKDGRYAVDRVRLRDGQRTTVPLATDALKPPEGVNDQSKLPHNVFQASRFAFTNGVVAAHGVWLEGRYTSYRQPKGFVLASKSLRGGGVLGRIDPRGEERHPRPQRRQRPGSRDAARPEHDAVEHERSPAMPARPTVTKRP